MNLNARIGRIMFHVKHFWGMAEVEEEKDRRFNRDVQDGQDKIESKRGSGSALIL